MTESYDAIKRGGYHPFPAPCGILLNKADRTDSECIRCATCDGYPCLVHAKADADIIAVLAAGAANTAKMLTAIANAIRVGEHIADRLGASVSASAQGWAPAQRQAPAQAPSAAERN